MSVQLGRNASADFSDSTGGAIVNIGTVLVDHAMAGLPSYVRRELEEFLSRGILLTVNQTSP